MANRDITAEDVRRCFNYNPETGLLTWSVRSANRIKIGDRAGTPKSDGYLVVRLLGRYCLAHRLVWMHVYGSYPCGEIDHINGVRSDNRLKNLRHVTHAQNMQNQRRAGKSGYLGVYPERRGSKFSARIGHDGVVHYLGLFSDPEEAHAAYLEAKTKLHAFRPQ